jgi:hypothetical protein
MLADPAYAVASNAYDEKAPAIQKLVRGAGRSVALGGGGAHSSGVFYHAPMP